MDDFYGLDQLDRWLNSQRGPRRLLLLWLDGMPLAVLAGAALLGWLTMQSLAGASTPDLRTVAAVIIVLAIPFGFLMSGLLTLSLRLDRSDSRRFQPRFSWRRSAYSALFTIWPDFSLAYLSIDRHVPMVPPWSFALGAIATLGLCYWNDRYLRQAAKARLGHAQGQVC